MKNIIINSKFGKKKLVIDDDNLDRFSEFTWHIVKSGNNYYACANVKKNNIVDCKTMKRTSNRTKILSNGKNKKYTVHYQTLYAHWLALNYNGDYYIDHINHNGLDNRRENLRKCTHSDNLQNSRLSRINKTGHKNIYKERGKYTVEKKINNKKYRKRGFNNIEEAINYRNKLVVQLGYVA